jgi:membrane-associated phospholipid phosphatase
MPHPAFELWLINVIASLGGASEFLDHAMYLLLFNDFLKGVPFATVLFLLWAVPRTQQADTEREAVLLILLATTLSLMIGRAIQGLINSPRPLMVPEIAALYPPIFYEYRLDWNAFPSDHMALYLAVAFGVFLVRRALGMALISWCLVGVGFPRLYAGYHYPIDILGGMAVAAASLALVWLMRGWLLPWSRKTLQLAGHYPALVTAAMFCLCFQIATVFNTVRELGEFGRVGMRILRTALLY